MEQAKPVVLTKPVRGREMLSKKGPLEKVAPGGAVEAEKVDKKRVETYYEGYVDGQLFLVPDSNLEAMKDMINFKMRPKTSIRYKHQTSYDIQYYDQFTEKLNELLAKIDDFQEFAEPDPKESLDRESTEESIVEEKEEVPEEMPEEEEQVGMAEEEKEEIPEEEKEEIPEEVEEEKPVEEEIPEEVEQEKSEEEKEEIPEEAEEEKPEEEEIPEEVEQEKPEEEKEEIPEEAEEEKPEEEEIPEEVQEEKPEEEEIPEEVEQENPEEEKEEIPKEPSAGVVSEDKKSVSKVKSSSAGIESVKSKIETLKSTIMEELKNEYVPESICSVTSSEHSQAEPQKTAKSKEDASNELRFRFLISGHFKDGQSPTYMVHEYEEKYDTIFKEQKLDFSSIEENDNANVFISGKLYTENILVGSKGDMFFNTKPEKILINKEKSKVFKNSFEQTFEKEDYCIMLRGKSMKQKNSKITPIISLGMQKKSQRNGEPQPKTK